MTTVQSTNHGSRLMSFEGLPPPHFFQSAVPLSPYTHTKSVYVPEENKKWEEEGPFPSPLHTHTHSGHAPDEENKKWEETIMW